MASNNRQRAYRPYLAGLRSDVIGRGCRTSRSIRALSSLFLAWWPYGAVPVPGYVARASTLRQRAYRPYLGYDGGGGPMLPLDPGIGSSKKRRKHYSRIIMFIWILGACRLTRILLMKPIISPRYFLSMRIAENIFVTKELGDYI